MRSKEEIVKNWLPRYTGTPLEEFGRYILLTNFRNYVDMFAKKFNVPVRGESNAMQTATHDELTIVNFGMGSANAATIMDLLSAVSPDRSLSPGKVSIRRKKRLRIESGAQVNLKCSFIR